MDTSTSCIRVNTEVITKNEANPALHITMGYDSKTEVITKPLLANRPIVRRVDIVNSCGSSCVTSWFFHTPPLCPCPRSRQQTTAWLRGRVSQDVAGNGVSLSPLAVPDKGRERRLAAKVRGRKGQERRPAQHKRSSAHRPLCRRSGTDLASGKEFYKLSGQSSALAAAPLAAARHAATCLREQGCTAPD